MFFVLAEELFPLNISVKLCLSGNGDTFQRRSGSGSGRGEFLFGLPVSG